LNPVEVTEMNRTKANHAMLAHGARSALTLAAGAASTLLAAGLAYAGDAMAQPGAQTSIPAFGVPADKQTDTLKTGTLKECEQDNVASFSIRACTILLSGDSLDDAERARIHKLRGRSWLTEDDPGQAALDYSRALKLQPGDEEALRGRVRAYDLQERFDLAAQDWSTLIKTHPKDDALYRSRGASYLGAKRFDEALADYGRSLELNPKALDAYIGRARVHDALGERDKATEQLQLAIAIDSNYLPAFWERARMADRWGEREVAIDNYITVLKINGQYAHARKYLERLGVYSPY